MPSTRPKPPPLETAREERILNGILTGAVTAEDQVRAWRRHFEQNVRFPFSEKCCIEVQGVHLRQGDIVSVIGVASPELGSEDVVVRVISGDKSIRVPLFQLTPYDTDSCTRQAVEDWRYWFERGNACR